MFHTRETPRLHYSPPLLLTMIACLLAGGCGDPSSEGSQQSDPDIKKADAPCPGEIRVVEEFWPNGQCMLRKHVLDKPDGTVVEHGLYTKWHDNGNKSYEATFVQGKADGTVTRWHKNGQVWITQNYRNGLKQGVWTSYDEKGRKAKEERYDQDKPHGTWMIWKGSGELKWKASFSHGVPLEDSDKPGHEL